MLRLEVKGIALIVGHQGIVIRPRGVVRQGRVRGRRRGLIPLDKPETKKIVRNIRKSGRNHEGS
jgi:hypothetical protein